MSLILFLDVIITIQTIISFLFNIYVLVSVLMSKQVKKQSNLLIFHLSVCFTTISTLDLCFSVPSLFQGSFVTGSPTLCKLEGSIENILQPISLWTVSAIHIDRFISIAHPLRYPSITSTKKTLGFLTALWVGIIALWIPSVVEGLTFSLAVGSCLPNLYHNYLFAPSFYLLGYFCPLIIVITVNLKIVNIARYHQFRIANALFGMTPIGTAAGGHLTEGAKARERQADALKRFQGANAISTLAQYVGSLCFMYLPNLVLATYQLFQKSPETDKEIQGHGGLDPMLLKFGHILLLGSPIVNCFLFGFKNKTLQMTLINYARKEFYKCEVQNEIRLRSPRAADNRSTDGAVGGGGGNLDVTNSGFKRRSSRPSVGSFVGQLTFQVPYLNRQMSELSLVPCGPNGAPVPLLSDSLRGNSSQKTSPVAKRRGKGGFPKPAPMTRHLSDLSWRISELKGPFTKSCSDHSGLDCDRLKNSDDGEIQMRSRIGSQVSSDGSDHKLSPERKTNMVRKFGKKTILRFMPKAKQENADQGNTDDSLTDSELLKDSRLGTRRQSATSRISLGRKSSIKGSILEPARNALRGILQDPKSSPQNDQKDLMTPRILITRVQTIDQSSLEFLYPTPAPIQQVATDSDIIVRQMCNDEPDIFSECPLLEEEEYESQEEDLERGTEKSPLIGNVVNSRSMTRFVDIIAIIEQPDGKTLPRVCSLPCKYRPKTSKKCRRSSTKDRGRSISVSPSLAWTLGENNEHGSKTIDKQECVINVLPDEIASDSYFSMVMKREVVI